ncbi:MAG: hypothetical protein R3B91_04415 [Planctomycetaceae bacterium]
MDLPKVGTSHETTFIVEPQHTIPFPGLPPVLATPWIVWHLEATAYYMLQTSLPRTTSPSARGLSWTIWPRHSSARR